MNKWRTRLWEIIFFENIRNLYEAMKGYYYKKDVNLSFQVALWTLFNILIASDIDEKYPRKSIRLE